MTYRMDALATTAILGLCLLAFELSLRLLRHSRDKATSHGRSTIRVIWLVLLTVIIGSYLLMHYQWPAWAEYRLDATSRTLCASLFAIGLAVRWIAIANLGVLFTVDISRHQEHRLITSGLHGLVRHPSYSGLLVMIAAYSVTFENGIAAWAVFGTACLLIAHRIHVEEKFLVELFGDHYRRYQKTTGKLLPRLWA
jgi:protein-S-isoprenylcysteine O-methyltransferase Ste14